MSNAKNLSSLANVLDDGNAGEFLKSTGSGGVAFDTVAAGAVVYATADLLPLSGFAAGDMAYVTATNRFYINNGSGWYSISLVNTNPNITSVADASSGTTPFTLATDQTATVITITAADPEEVPLTYGYSVTTGDASLNGSTVAQGTGSNTNVFTVTPHASQDATFTITFTASDGINQATSDNEFSLSFVTTIAGSAKTSMLIASTISNNTNVTYNNIVSGSTPSQVIVDSANNHSIQVNSSYSESEIGLHDNTFSPYRSGGYSTYFDGTGYLQTSTINLTGNFTLEFWINLDVVTSDVGVFSFGSLNSTNTILELYNDTSGSFRLYSSTGAQIGSPSSAVTVGAWHHLAVTRSSNTFKAYLDGVEFASDTTARTINNTLLIGGYVNTNYLMNGHIRDFRITTNVEYPNDNFTPPSEPLTAINGTVLFTCHLPYIADGTGTYTITPNGGTFTKPFSPYDYSEYSATNNGGSVYFDGSGDYLTIPASTDFQLGTAGTINFWMFIDKTGNAAIMAGYNNANSLHIYCQNNFNLEWRDNNNVYYSATGIELFQKVWTYVSIVRSGTTLKVYLNGVEKASQPLSSTSEFGSDENLEIGNRSAISWTYKGYLSDFQIIKGTAIVPTPSTIPVAPSATHSNSKLHLKGGGASIINKAQTSKRINLVGLISGKVGTGTNGTAFASFNSNNFIKLFDKPAINQAITIEGFVYRDSYTNENPLIGIWLNSSNHVLLRPGHYNNHLELIHKLNGTNVEGTSTNSNAIPRQTWKHFAMTRDNSGNWKAYADGQQVNSLTESGAWDIVNNSSVEFHIGNAGSASFDGLIQDIRITESLRYTLDSSGNFTAPTAPLEG